MFLADDHPLLRSGLRSLLDAQPDMSVVGEAMDGETAVREVEALRPDVVVMDVSMPGLGGAEATERLRASAPEVAVLALTAHEQQGYLRRMMAAGARGFVVKRSAADDLVRAIRVVASGRTYIDPAVAEHLVAVIRDDTEVPSGELSDRESEVLRCVARGDAAKEIATRLDVGVRTVETYKVRGMKKLGLKTRAELVRHAVREGWFA